MIRISKEISFRRLGLALAAVSIPILIYAAYVVWLANGLGKMD